MKIFYFIPRPRVKIIYNGSSIIDEIENIAEYIPADYCSAVDEFSFELVWMSDFKYNKLPESTWV